jgi:autotransporter-associated beta strand protein
MEQEPLLPGEEGAMRFRGYHRFASILLACLAAGPLGAQITFHYDFASGATIPDFGQHVDSRVVADPGLTEIAAVTVRLDLGSADGSTMWLGDLYATLTHGVAGEGERVAVLLNRPGRTLDSPFGSDLDQFSVTLDDSAAVNVFAATSSSGVFRSDGRLSVDPFGPAVPFEEGEHGLSGLGGGWLPSNRWSLLLADTVVGEQAKLVGWGLDIQGSAVAGSTVTVSQARATFSGDTVADALVAAGGSATFLGPVSGSLQVAANGAATLRDGATLAQTTLLNDGQLTVNLETSSLAIGAAISGSGSMEKLGEGRLTLTGINAYSGPTVVAAGVFDLQGSLGSGQLTVHAPATMRGVGVAHGPATIFGLVKPGNSAGVLTFAGGLTLTATSEVSFEIAGLERGITYDGIDIGAGSHLVYGGTIDLRFAGDQQTGVYSLFHWSGGIAQSGAFSALTINGQALQPNLVNFSSGGWIAQVGQRILSFSNQSGELLVTPIPEPAAAALALGAVFGAFAWATRRRKAAQRKT